MAKTSPYSEDWLRSKGYIQNSDGSWEPPHFTNPLRKNTHKSTNISVDPNLIEALAPKHPVKNTPDFTLNKPLESFLTIDGIVAGLNGNKGLMRSHWSVIKKQKDLYRSIIREQLRVGKVRRHEGAVMITYIGYKSNLMDWDNFCSSFKHIGDSLVKEKIIVEDNPKIIQVFTPKQIKCKRVDQKVIVIIQDL